MDSLKQLRVISRYRLVGASLVLLLGPTLFLHSHSDTWRWASLYELAVQDPMFPSSAYDMHPTSTLAHHPPVEVAVRDGYWLGDNPGVWNRNYTCRSGLRCVARWDNGGYDTADVILTLSDQPGWHADVNRSRTKLAFLGMEPYHYDVDMGIFDIKASVYASEAAQDWRPVPGPPDSRHIWTTYAEVPWRDYLAPRAMLDWSKKSKSRAVMFVSSNSCPPHRAEIVHRLVEAGLDVWSFGSCASEHEHTDRVPQLKELCGDGGLYGGGDWREPKACITEHFKFILSIENTLRDDYVSEKFFHPFGVGTVPIYLGPENIGKYVPGPNSFIDMREFGEDYAGLIDLINYYNDNDEAYEKLFDWKRNRDFLPGFAEVNYRSWGNLACLLCEKSVEMAQ